MAKMKFPQTLFAKIENEGTENEFLETSSDMGELAEICETIVIAEYKLVRSGKAGTKVSWEPLKSKPKKV